MKTTWKAQAETNKMRVSHNFHILVFNQDQAIDKDFEFVNIYT